jgi:hypothetical protein
VTTINSESFVEAIIKLVPTMIKFD